jgi:hypothetical protein
MPLQIVLLAGMVDATFMERLQTMHKRPFSFSKIVMAGLVLSGILLASCSPTRVHKRPPHKKWDGMVGKLLHRKEMPCGC